MAYKNNLLEYYGGGTVPNRQGYQGGGSAEDMLVGYEDIGNINDPEVRARQKLAGMLGTHVQSTTESSPEYGFEQHIRTKPDLSVLGW